VHVEYSALASLMLRSGSGPKALASLQMSRLSMPSKISPTSIVHSQPLISYQHRFVNIRFGTDPIKNKHQLKHHPIRAELFIYRSIQRRSLLSTQVLVQIQIQIQNTCEHLKMRQSTPKLNAQKPLHVYHYNNQKHPKHSRRADVSILWGSQHRLMQFGRGIASAYLKIDSVDRSTALWAALSRDDPYRVSALETGGAATSRYLGESVLVTMVWLPARDEVLPAWW
jgi:hypothetical protein